MLKLVVYVVRISKLFSGIRTYYKLHSKLTSCLLLPCSAGWWSPISTDPIRMTTTTAQTGRLLRSPVCPFRQVLDLVSPAVPVQALSPASPRACCPNSLPRSETRFANIMFSTRNRHKAQGIGLSPNLSPNTFLLISHV